MGERERVVLARERHGIRRKDDPTDLGVGPWNVIPTAEEAEALRHMDTYEVREAVLLPEGEEAEEGLREALVEAVEVIELLAETRKDKAIAAGSLDHARAALSDSTSPKRCTCGTGAKSEAEWLEPRDPDPNCPVHAADFPERCPTCGSDNWAVGLDIPCPDPFHADSRQCTCVYTDENLRPDNEDCPVHFPDSRQEEGEA